MLMDRIWLKSYPPGVPAEIDPSQLRSLKELIEKTCAEHADRVAFIQMGAQLTYRELDELSRAFAAWLQREGFRKGDRIAIMLPNTLQYPIAMFGALRAGLTVVNTNPLYTAPELEYQLSDSGATVILVLENFAHIVQKVLRAHEGQAGTRDLSRGVSVIPQIAARQLRRAPRAQAGAGVGHSRRNYTEERRRRWTAD